jgi:hypothetical protein
MNTKAPLWLDYIKFYTTRPATLAIVPKAVTAQPVTDAPAILCAVRLAPRTYYYTDGRQVTREQWSHRVYEFVGYSGDYVLLKTVQGIIGRKVADVQGLPVMAEAKVA